MQVDKLIHLFEDLVFELLSWVLFLPRTLLFAIVPGRVPRYVAEEWEKEVEERYDRIVSPVLFFLLMILASSLLYLPRSPAGFFQSLLALQDMEILQLFLATFMWPLLYAIALQLIVRLRWRKDFGRSDFRRLFDVQCLLWGVNVLVNVAGEFVLSRWSLPPLLVGLPFLAYFAWLEQPEIAQELKIPASWSFVVAGALAVGTTLVVALLFGDPYAPLYQIS